MKKRSHQVVMNCCGKSSFRFSFVMKVKDAKSFSCEKNFQLFLPFVGLYDVANACVGGDFLTERKTQHKKRVNEKYMKRREKQATRETVKGEITWENFVFFYFVIFVRLMWHHYGISNDPNAPRRHTFSNGNSISILAKTVKMVLSTNAHSHT